VPKQDLANAIPPAKEAPDDDFSDPKQSTDVCTWANRKASVRAQRANNARAASVRRRLVDPTTCDRDYSPAELEFMQAMQEYKQWSGRMYPTWSEALEVLMGLGYEKRLSGDAPAPRGDPPHCDQPDYDWQCNLQRRIFQKSTRKRPRI
jgi:hypothetical protein